MLPLRHRSPGEFAPVDVWVDGQILEERLEFHGVVISGVEESFERPDVGALFLEKLDNRFSFPLVGGGGVWQQGCGGSVPDVRLVMEEIGDFLVEADEAVMAIERWDVIGRVGLGGRGHCCHCCAVLKADCWDGSENCIFFL